ncbi:MAG: hypothetical protein WA624_13905 [Methylocella sp.]
MNDEKNSKTSTRQAKKRITSESFAALIIDALVDAKVVTQADVARAIGIAKEEIDARKAAGDY